jgi:uncharacterized membrane protein YraQ (UPF0718 family)
MTKSCCTVPEKKTDWLLWGSLIVITISYLLHWQFSEALNFSNYAQTFTQSSFELLNKMSWGIALGIFFVGIVDKIPKDFIAVLFGHKGFKGIWRATLAGVLLDLCSHGILMVGMKFYERGIRLGQLMAFLIASPWNSFSLTLILWSLVGFKLMMTFLLLSMVIALISGVIFDKLVDAKILPSNPQKLEIPSNFDFWQQAKTQWTAFRFSPQFALATLKSGILGSKMVLRWTFFGVILASLLRTFVSPESFATLFGATLAGLGMTILIATILEVCSEGSTPIASDLVVRAGAPGNGFAFLMTGVSTDYTEIMSIKDTTKSWKISLFLPLVTLPQIILLAWILNNNGDIFI